MIISIRLIILLNLICFLKAGGLWHMDSLSTRALEGTNRHPGLDYTMESISLATPCIEWGFILGLNSGAWRNGKTDRQEFVQLATLGLVATQLGVGLFKYAVNRKRPIRRYEPRLWNTRLTPSFPSGHAASSAVFASIAARQYPAARPLIAAYVVASAYSQVYIGNHYALDVLAGMIVGGAMGNWILGTFDASKTTPAVISIYLPIE